MVVRLFSRAFPPPPPAWRLFRTFHDAEKPIRESSIPNPSKPLSTFLSENNANCRGVIFFVEGEVLLNLNDSSRSNTEKYIQQTIESDQADGLMFNLAKDYVLYSKYFWKMGDRQKTEENLQQAIKTFKDCGADGWVEKYEGQLAAM